MLSIGLADGVAADKKEVLHRFDELNWHSWWQTVCDLERSLDEAPSEVVFETEPVDQRDAIAVETLGLALDLDEEWMLYRMKSWVRTLEAQIKELF